MPTEIHSVALRLMNITPDEVTKALVEAFAERIGPRGDAGISFHQDAED